jgi:hypothetical protein
MARLTAKALVNFQNVNSFQYANQWNVNAGDTTTLYFQLADIDQGAYNSIGGPLTYGLPVAPLSGNAGLRYIAGVGSSNQPVAMKVTFPSIDNSKTLTLAALQDPNDGSIFSVTIPSTLTPAGGNVVFKLTEGLNIKTFSALNLLAVSYPGADGSDGSLPNSGCC